MVTFFRCFPVKKKVNKLVNKPRILEIMKDKGVSYQIAFLVELFCLNCSMNHHSSMTVFLPHGFC